MALAPVITNTHTHTDIRHKHVAEVQSHRGLIRDRRNKSVFKRNTSAASDGGPSQSHCVLYKSSKIKIICCQELMFVNLLHSRLFKPQLHKYQPYLAKCLPISTALTIKAAFAP